MCGQGAQKMRRRKVAASAFREEFPFPGTESRGCLGKTYNTSVLNRSTSSTDCKYQLLSHMCSTTFNSARKSHVW